MRAQSAGTVKYADCITADGFDQTAVLSMTLNNIWWGGSSPGALEYTSIGMTPMPTRTRIGSTC